MTRSGRKREDTEAPELSVLVVDDNSVDRQAIERALPATFEIHHAATGADARQQCTERRPDCAIVDYRLPDTTGLELLPFLLARNIPAVLLTGFDEGGLAADAILRGAQDYLTKDRLHPQLLETTVRRAVQRHRADEQFRLALEAAPSGMILCDENGRMKVVNAAAERMFGYDRSELIDRPVEMLVPSKQRDRHSDMRAQYGRAPSRKKMGDRSVLAGQRANGETFPVEVGLSPIRAMKGTYVLASVVDLSAQREMERQMHASQRMEAVGRLAGGVAHDFNNLLTVIQTYASFLLRQFREGDPAYADVQAIGEAGTRAAKLTRQLLAFSGRQHLEPRIQSINDLVTDIESMMRRLIGEQIEVIANLAQDAGLVHVDPTQIDQVLVNLAVNARDAMPDGGTLTIETGNVELAAARGEVPPGRYVCLSVADTGEGMNEATLDRIFEPFFTTKDRDKGTGLGLSTVHGIVHQSGGYIRVSSTVNAGTRFDIYLPITDAPAKRVAPRAPREQPRGTETILLVEDERLVRMATTRVLERQGYEVLSAANGPDALLIADEHDGPIDLLLTDVVLPTVSGPSLASRLRQRRPNVGVIFMSGYTDAKLSDRRWAAPGETFVQKPFEIDVLLDKVREKLLSRPEDD